MTKEQILQAFCDNQEGQCDCSIDKAYCFRGKLSTLLDSYRAEIEAETVGDDDKHDTERPLRPKIKLEYSDCSCKKPERWFTCKGGADICNWCGGHIKQQEGK